MGEGCVGGVILRENERIRNMQWNDHPLFWKATADRFRLKGNAEVVVPQILNTLSRPGLFGGNEALQINTLADLRDELEWIKDGRPFYNLYPSVAEAFTKVDLSKLNCDQVRLPIRHLLIRFAEGKELVAKGTRIKSILVGETLSAVSFVRKANWKSAKVKVGSGERLPSWIMRINDGSCEIYEGIRIPIHTLSAITLVPKEPIMSRLVNAREHNYVEGSDINNDVVELAYRIVCALCLLRENSDLIEPLPLESDRAKWEATHDWKLIEKAARRGKKGWAVGKHIEVAPGFRRPHFAIRWMGKGRIRPELRPIRGCLVRKREVQEVPTGFLDEGAE